MTEALRIARHYFELSNDSNMDAIEKLFTSSSTYSSENSGIFLGRNQILKMQRNFHSSFKHLFWDVLDVSEISPGIVLFDFHLTGEMHSGDKISVFGLEYVIIFNQKIQHIEIRNK